MTEKVRAAAYVRVSTAAQANEGLSLDEQVRRVHAYIAAQGWELVDTFTERGVSGAVPFDERPESQKLMNLVDRIDRIVIPKLDRLGRSTKALLDAFEKFENAGVGVVSLAESIDTATPVGKLTRTLLAAIAEFERDRMKERVGEVVDARARKGEHHGGPPPYGYRYADKGGLIVVPGEAVVVRRIFAEFVAGKTQRQIVRDLNADGLKAHRASARWYQGTISTLLKNPIYSGRVRTNGKVYDGRHEAVIDEQTWRRACQLHSAPKTARRAKANHLLAGGLLRCSCGSPMNAVTKPTRKAGRLYERYVCSRRIEDGVDACPVKPIRRDLIDGAIWTFFERVALDVDATRAALTEQHDTKLAELSALHDHAVGEAQRTRAALARMERDYRDEKLTAEQWSRLDAKLTSELVAADAQAVRLDEQWQAITEDRDTFDVETAVLEELTRLRAEVVGEAQASGRTGVDALRATLRRLFTFELLTPNRPFGTAVEPDGVAMPHDDLVLDELTILPHVRTDGVTDWWDEETAFPALRRASLELRAFDGNSLVTTSSAPRSKPRTRSISPARPVRMITGIEGSRREATPSASRTRRTSSSPDPSGRPRSTSASAGRLYSSTRSASRTVSAASTS